MKLSGKNLEKLKELLGVNPLHSDGEPLPERPDNFYGNLNPFDNTYEEPEETSSEMDRYIENLFEG